MSNYISTDFEEYRKDWEEGLSKVPVDPITVTNCTLEDKAPTSRITVTLSFTLVVFVIYSALLGYLIMRSY